MLKPVRDATGCAEAVRRVVESRRRAVRRPRATDETDRGRARRRHPVRRPVRRSRYVEAQGDYARLHTADGSHLLRVPLSTLEDWAAAGFVRIHRIAAGRARARRRDAHRRRAVHRCVGRGTRDELPVSRRHTRELRDLLGRPE